MDAESEHLIKLYEAKLKEVSKRLNKQSRKAYARMAVMRVRFGVSYGEEIDAKLAQFDELIVASVE